MDELISDLAALRLEQESIEVPEGSSNVDLDRDAFLTIFLAQLESQDPLNPQDSSELGVQLAQFSQLEQAVNTTEALGDIGTKLDELIELQRGPSQARLDPVSLIGRRIDFPSDELVAPSGSDSPDELKVALSESRSALVFQVTDEVGANIGVFSIATPRPPDVDVPSDPTDPQSPKIKVTPPFPPLAEGDYALRFRDGRIEVEGPNGRLPAEFTRVRRVDGSLRLVTDEAGDPVPFQFAPGSRYTFSVQAADGNGEQETLELEPTRTGLVDSVRLVDGAAKIISSGIEVDPAQIVRILNATP